MPKSTGAYVKILMKEFGATLKQEIMECYKGLELDDHILNYMLSNPDGEFINHEE